MQVNKFYIAIAPSLTSEKISQIDQNDVVFIKKVIKNKVILTFSDVELYNLTKNKFLLWRHCDKNSKFESFFKEL